MDVVHELPLLDVEITVSDVAAIVRTHDELLVPGVVVQACDTLPADHLLFLTDHVLPELPLRQLVLAVPKRLRYFLERDAALQGVALHLFLREVE